MSSRILQHRFQLEKGTERGVFLMQEKIWKRTGLWILFLTFWVSLQGVVEASGGTTTSGKLGRAAYTLHVPVSYNEKALLPLVVVLDADTSDKVSEGFITTNAKNNFTDGYILLAIRNAPDLSLNDTIAVIAKVRSEYPIDDTMVFGASVTEIVIHVPGDRFFERSGQDLYCAAGKPIGDVSDGPAHRSAASSSARLARRAEPSAHRHQRIPALCRP